MRRKSYSYISDPGSLVSNLYRRLLLAGVCLAALASGVNGQRLVDQILTTVNNEVITRTDLFWSIALDPAAPDPSGNVSSDILRRKLDVMIDERLIAREAAQVPGAEITADEISKKRTELIASFKSEAVFRQRVESVGLTRERIDDLIRERLLIERFVEFRFQSFVFVSDQEVKRYYDEQIVPEVRKGGQVPPPIEQVRDMIATRIKAEKINDEIDRWLIEARQRADIVTLAEP